MSGRAGLTVAVATAVLVGACAPLSSTARMSFYPRGGERSDRFSTELRRSCELGDCRVQRVEMPWRTGEVLTGELRLLTVGVTPVEATVGPVPATSALLDDVPRRRPGVMTLEGNRGSRVKCELIFSAGTRHAVGTCKTSTGETYTVDL